MSKKRKQIWALVLSTALIAAHLSAVTTAETAAPEDKVNFATDEREGDLEYGSIASFAALDKNMKKQEIPVGTKLFDLNLPDTLKVRIYSISSDVTDAEQENGKDPSKENPTASPAEADKGEERATTDSSGTGSTKIDTKLTRYDEEIPVTWDSSPVYDGDRIGNYVFTADVGSYLLSEGVKLPQITVTVVGTGTAEPVPAVKKISRWSFVDDDNLNEGVLPLSRVSIDNQADFDAVVSMLPTQILAEIDDSESTAIEQEVSKAQAVEIISWDCTEYQKDGQGKWPVSGEYTFTAMLESGYRCNPLPSVKVLLGGASLFTINDRFTVEGLSYKELGPDTVQLMGYDGEKPEGTLIIPDTVIKPANGREYKVIRIGENAFEDCAGLTGDLIIPDTVIEIGENAFLGCNYTGSLILPDSLIKIGTGAFYESGFTGELHLPEKLTHIGTVAFYKTGFTGRLILPEELTYIGSRAFFECKFTGDLLIPDSVRHLAQGAFNNTKFTGKLTLSKGLTEIESETFISCGFTGKLTIPDTITRIDSNAFQNCNFTGELVLPDGITSIGELAFDGCSGLTGRLRIPDGLTECGERAFEGTSIEAFNTTKQSAADLLYRSEVPEDKITVGNQPYQPSPDKKTFPYGDMKYEVLGSDSVKLISYKGNPDEDVFIPDTVTDSSGKSYFVTHIGKGAFRDQAITGSLRLPDTLVCIEKWAFGFNQFEGRLSLPDTLTYIDENAFRRSGFTGDLSIPENVSYIGAVAFLGTSFTGDLTIEGKLTVIEDVAFSDCGFTGALTLPDTLTSIGANAFESCGFTGSLSLPEGLEIIGSRAFYDCSSFSGALNLPEPVTEIGDSAFYGCNGLDSAHLGSNLQKLGQQAFPESLPLSTSSPRVQLLINTYLNQDAIADASWDGKEDVPAGALVTVKQNVTLDQDRRIGMEAESTIQKKSVMNVNKQLTVDGRLVVRGTLIINGTLTGSGTLYIARGGRVIGDISGIKVEYEPGSSSSGGGGGSYTNPDILHGTWTLTETGIWMFRQTGGDYAKSRWGLIGGLWYYFNADGHMLTGWQQLNGVWYYLHTAEDAGSTAGIQTGVKEGAMKTGWHFDSLYHQWFYFNINGSLADGWLPEAEKDFIRFAQNPSGIQ